MGGRNKMVETLKVPRGYERYRKRFLEKLKKGEIEAEESKKEDLFYVA